MLKEEGASVPEDSFPNIHFQSNTYESLSQRDASVRAVSRLSACPPVRASPFAPRRRRKEEDRANRSTPVALGLRRDTLDGSEDRVRDLPLRSGHQGSSTNSSVEIVETNVVVLPMTKTLF
ncbi:uncharacterized protein LOC112456501 [Temnothorax curvispinosus]|uniref:Uncharacterized protein LOC112456501 n=1 Tax=Temnothorax curvispinosus TaxID=300111 RepID=A0A6J1PY57_9HYME|nr:uncharacterized protein LOC112456501 [Temnothorax curvispinosus]